MQLFTSFDANVKLIRSDKRRTVSIHISYNTIILRVPYHLPDSAIERLIVKKQNWIQQKLAAQRHHKPIQHQFNTGDQLSFLGNSLTLSFSNNTPQASLEDAHLILPTSAQKNIERIKKLLQQWYLTQAENYLPERTHILANKVGVTPIKIKIRFYKSRWGSCSSNGTISYNWLIMMAPKLAVDYVIIHELCHLYELNHSPKYWQWVAHFMPDYQQHQQWFKANAHTLCLT